MAKKKMTKKRNIKRAINKPENLIGYSQNKIKIVLRNLIVFVVLTIISMLLYEISTEEIYVNLFWLLSVLFGFVAIALLIALLAILFIRVLKK